MKRIDIYIAVGVFLILVGVYEYNLTHAIESELVKFLLNSTFGALLALFQSRARIDAHTDDGNVTVTK